ncbi:TPA: hypothetical protein ACKU3G_004052 [Bacillus cereus]|nr:hypothetical protein [Bacillus cereus]
MNVKYVLIMFIALLLGLFLFGYFNKQYIDDCNQKWAAFNGKIYRIPKNECGIDEAEINRKLKLDCLIGYAHDSIKRIDMLDGERYI